MQTPIYSTYTSEYNIKSMKRLQVQQSVMMIMGAILWL